MCTRYPVAVMRAEIAKVDARIAALIAGLPDPFPEIYAEEDGDYGDTNHRTLPQLRARRHYLAGQADLIADA